MSYGEHELLIERISYGGAGIGRLNGKVVFVPFTIPGERVRVKVLRDKKKFVEAELLEVLSPSEERQSAKCPHFTRCGGCAYQHVDYPTQITWKTDQVRDLLKRVGGISDPVVHTALASPREWAFRNRIRVHSKDGKTGFYAKHAHDIVDVRECPIASGAVNAELAQFRKHPHPPDQRTLSEKRGVNFFEQTNDGAAEVLATLVESLVESLVGDAGGILVDAYSGAGFFGHRLAPRFQKVIGIETHSGAVAAARERALAHESYICGDVEVCLGEVLQAGERKQTTVLLDPPATGVSVRVSDLLGSLPVRKVVYVSCDPATLARDLGVLLRAGYKLVQVTPVDMFPQTADIEAVAELVFPF